jgi:selenocysteine lyase/cysteine desulfurase
VSDLRSRFPVCDRFVYLGAGTDGPLPASAADAARAAIADQLESGRWFPHFTARKELHTDLREAFATALGCHPLNVALTSSTTEGLGRVLAGLDLRPGDEILTSDQEHPGLLGPLMAARDRGAAIRVGPLARLSEAVEPSTTLIACSHVGWVDGQVADPALGSTGIPLIFDGAQGVGAIAVDLEALNCVAYAGPGQKWLCGADGTGMLYVEPEFGRRVRAVAPGYFAFADASLGLESLLHDDARRHDSAALPREAVAATLAAVRELSGFGWAEVHARGVDLAQRLVDRLTESGRIVAPRGPTTLVAWEDEDPPVTREKLAENGVILRDLPGTKYLRASVGAWNDESDLDRLLELL